MSRRAFTTSSTYTLAHTAQCKLKLAANRPDRNLRFVLGHAFTLDNLMLRIVEIENKSAKSLFEEGKAPSNHGADEHYDCTAATPVAAEPDPHYDCAAAQPDPAKPAGDDRRGRRISFQDNNARPSSIGTAGVALSNTNGNGTSSPARRRSPPPVSISPSKYLSDGDEDDDTSSDDYDDPESYLYNCEAGVPEAEKPAVRRRPVHDAYSDEEDAALDLADDELDDDLGGLSLTRFQSASAQPPRMVRSDSSSSEEDLGDEPVTPPQLPADVDVRDIIGGEKDDELEGLYESVRRCGCHGHRGDPDLGRKAHGVWDIPVEKAGGKHLAVVAVAG
ncbi:hypothetical protein G647_00764 [Cladophialophora carrionii CBS 160.54]|uniref:Uncharacterized protein n=1 Tax=Cladophialophora carrionii CBS 160.54 TaxID=1279043 RepID=V9DN56_9EURO|nr:uncharacterized protein G647_00764 [Cladophialophora carrionii CBS 160.54]ETI28315.1 hypothetical protein G647_00764 [Cladophialophora carrionii CBS 160.54]